jgi:NADH:ubiquinone oxidoreductase subunit 5 (subunit L)/multisubunit Na+/H+ antiporter MnhA subunit
LYGREPIRAQEPDELERWLPNVFNLLRRKYFVDEIYDWAVVGFTRWYARACDWIDQWIFEGGVQLLSWLAIGFSWLDGFFDEHVVNAGFDDGCRRLTQGGSLLTRLQNGRVQNYLRVIGVGLTVLVLILLWGCHA